MQVIAERDKKVGKVLLSFGVVLVGLSIYPLFLSLWYTISLIFGLFISIVGLYSGLLLPKIAITKENDTLIIHYAFCKKQIAFSKIEYVSYHELGPFATQNGSLFHIFYRFKNDIRTLTITAKEDSCLKHFYVFSVIHASATTITINNFVEQAKKD